MIDHEIEDNFLVENCSRGLDNYGSIWHEPDEHILKNVKIWWEQDWTFQSEKFYEIFLSTQFEKLVK